MKKFTIIAKIFTLIAIVFFILGADNITRTLPDGTDLSTLMCRGNIIYIGDLSRDVLKKCGEPIKKTRFTDQPGRVWVYQLDQVDHVFYLAFIDGKLERIFDVSCLVDNTDCN
jgi:hypothetical protein